jgi:tetratricopeptide (TPR) repeat protein
MRKSPSPPGSQEPPANRSIALWLGIVLLLTAAAYLPALRNGWTNWDDDVYVTANRSLQDWVPGNTPGMFARFHNGNYHPLTMLSLALDYRLSGSAPFTFHLENVVLHIANTAFVFWLLILLFPDLRIVVPAAALFGVHTLHVESVAWVSERKDVLYAFFFFAALICYVKSGPGGKLAPGPGADPDGSRRKETASRPAMDRALYRPGFLAGALGLFLLSLLSKGQAVTLAPTLVLVDHLRGRRLLERRNLAEKAPFFLLALIFGVVAVHAQQSAAAIFDHAAASAWDRVIFACYGFSQYLVKLALPIHLSALYPYPGRIAGALPAQFHIYPAAVAVFAAAAALAFRRSRPVFFGMAFFTVNIVLVLQLLPVGNAIMADRYSYVPSMGIFLLAGLAYRRVTSIQKAAVPMLRLAVGAYIVMLSGMTMSRCAVWKDSLTLWQDAVAKSPASEVAWCSLGSSLDEEGRYAESQDDYSRALALHPGFAKAYSNRARCRAKLGDPKGALADAESALRLRPDLAYTHTTLGVAQLAAGDTQAAKSSFARALEIDAGDAQAFAGRAAVKTKSGDLAGALADLDTAIRLSPDSADPYSNRGIVKAESGDTAGGLADFSKAIALSPRQPGPYINRAVLYLKLGNRPAACGDLQQALRSGAKLSETVIRNACSP